jgi:hypothetical protein
MKRSLIIISFGILGCAFTYKNDGGGKPWHKKMQEIPGKIECEYYNEGGEGVAYHDSDRVNNGSGKLNPVNGNPLNEFRLKEGVDISYTKSGDIDNNAYNKVSRDLNKFYVGWTVPGEWINYTVSVKQTGTYQIGVMYTANGNGVISLDADGKNATGPLRIASTHDDQDTVKWRQWHHWNASNAIGTIKLNKGIHVLKLHIVANGEMNLDYLKFTKI